MASRMVCRSLLVCAVLLVLISAAAAAGDNYLVMYVVGSDLESGYDEATDNLRDLEDNAIGVDQNAGGQPTQHVVERFAGADISEPQTLANSMAYAESIER